MLANAEFDVQLHNLYKIVDSMPAGPAGRGDHVSE